MKTFIISLLCTFPSVLFAGAITGKVSLQNANIEGSTSDYAIHGLAPGDNKSVFSFTKGASTMTLGIALLDAGLGDAKGVVIQPSSTGSSVDAVMRGQGILMEADITSVSTSFNGSTYDLNFTPTFATNMDFSNWGGVYSTAYYVMSNNGYPSGCDMANSPGSFSFDSASSIGPTMSGINVLCLQASAFDPMAIYHVEQYTMTICTWDANTGTVSTCNTQVRKR